MSNPISISFYGQSSFIIKTSFISIGIDLYLSHAVERIYGFKRMTPILISPKDVNCDVLISTHHHEDHLDIDSIEVMMKKNTIFLGALDTKGFITNSLTINQKNAYFLVPGDKFEKNGVIIEAVECDHGFSAPNAIGIIINILDQKIYIAGDTSFRPDLLEKISFKGPYDVAIFPINGTFGNLNSLEAVSLLEIIKPKIAIPSHFWTFIEQKGDPINFLENFKSKNFSDTKLLFMAPGESIII